MDEFIRRIESSLSIQSKKLSLVKNPDGFLNNPETQQQVLAECGLLLLPIKNSLELRIRYELYDKFSNERVCYIMDDPDEVLPDLRNQMFIAPTFSVSDLMPAYDETELRMSQLSFGIASYLFKKKYTYNLSVKDTKEMVLEAANYFGEDPKVLCDKLLSIPLIWDNVETIDSISSVLLKAISQGCYDKVESALSLINTDFQQYLDSKYFSLASSNHVIRPKIVNKILPHIFNKYNRTDKIALIVIDGMSYWQYLVLDRFLTEEGLSTKKDITMSWLPSITKLSRQAIFKGNIPNVSYTQNPIQEEKLWNDFWTENSNRSKRMSKYEVSYTYDSLLASDYNRYKQAFVDASLDHKMHSSSNNKDLYDLTVNWAKDAAENIKLLHEQGFIIYITTDHGNIMAHSWRALKQSEKTYLYEKDSRGDRYLMYKDENYKNEFLQNNEEIVKDLLVHENWLVWRDSNCFAGKDEITHGGSHFLEVVIPFITIEK